MTLEKKMCKYCNKLRTVFDYHNPDKCWECKKEDEYNQIGERTKEKGYSNNESEIFCPYCGYHCSDDERHESDIIWCDSCDKKFQLEVEWSASYSTSKIEEEE